MAARAGAMDDTVELPSLAGNDRHHEALVADGNELFLEQPFFTVRLQKTLERFLNRFLPPLDIAAQALEGDARMVGHGAIGQDLAVELLQQRPEFTDGARARPKSRKSLRSRGQNRLGVGRAIEQREQV